MGLTELRTQFVCEVRDGEGRCLDGQADLEGMVILALSLQERGLRLLERKVRYSIEANRTAHVVRDKRHGFGDVEVRWTQPLWLLEGVLRVGLFDWPVAYGLAIIIVLVLAVAMTVAYVPFVGYRDERPERESGIYRIWPNERLRHDAGEPRLETYGDVDGEKRIERLRAERLRGVWGYAFYFSLLSAFRIGFRELNLGVWVGWLQPSDYTLRARGTRRVISGVQSIISLYLVAMALLTSFGRPFQ